MNTFKRTFLALRIPLQKQLADTLAELKNELFNHKIKWSDANEAHLTLHFFGNTSSKQIEIVKEILNHNAHKFKSFTLQITGLGLFYHDKKPSVIWAGIAENDELTKIFSIIEKELLSNDFKLESRSFKPHITMGRIKYTEHGNTLKNTIKNYENTFFQDTAIDELYFYESILQTQAALYVPLSVIKF